MKKVLKIVNKAPCTCIADVDAGLARCNAQIVSTIIPTPPRAMVDVMKKDATKKWSKPALMATFCPFCGKQYAS